MILSDWRDTDAGMTKNLKKVALFLLCINISTGTTPDSQRLLTVLIIIQTRN